MTDAPLSPEEIRQLLRECVTVVKPGETLILRCPENWTPDQAREIQQRAAWWLQENAPHIKAMIIPPLEITVMEHDDAEAFAVRVMNAINALQVLASVDGGGYVRAHAKFKADGQWWPSDEARKAQEQP